MLSITPCRKTISDRFPVASFVVQVPSHRVFEIACATDASLLRGDQRARRTPENFFSSRGDGLLRASAGQATYLLPPGQLRRFAGKSRLYYAVASYGDPRGNSPEFTVSPEEPERAPYVSLSQDFTGRTLDRSRLRHRAGAEARYGAAGPALTWGADRYGQAAAPAAGQQQQYDDGYSADLWKTPTGPRALGTELEDPPDPPDAATLEEPPGAEDAPALRAQQEAEAYGRRSSGGYGSGAAPVRAYGRAGHAVPVEAFSVPEPPGDEHPRHDSPIQTFAGAARDGTNGEARLGNPEGPSLGEPPGAEDPHELRGRSPRYGDASGAAAASPAHATTAAPVLAAGKDDHFEDALGPDAEGELSSASPSLEAGALTIPAKFRLVQQIAPFESGAEGYSAIDADGEFNDATHSAYQRAHVGLSWGLVQFNQRGGGLGRVLVACERRAPVLFRETFGKERDRLLQVTTAATEEERLQPVGGTPLWHEPWVARFRHAGRVPQFQAAQNEVAIEAYLDPNLSFAAALGLDSDRALAMLYDRFVHMGNAAARRFVIDAVTPLRDEAAIRGALQAVGQDSVQAFQRSVGLVESATLGPKGHAALIGALRKLGAKSPVQVPSLPTLLDKLVQASHGRRFEQRMIQLRASSELSDLVRRES
jgi:Glycosyl hydrolase family 46